MDRLGYVYFNNVFAGILEKRDPGYVFRYDTQYLGTGIPIGFHFPLSKAEYFSGELFPLFENLVSEGWLLDLQARSQHLDPEDKFGLLLKNGKDLTGALTIREEKI